MSDTPFSPELRRALDGFAPPRRHRVSPTARSNASRRATKRPSPRCRGCRAVARGGPVAERRAVIAAALASLSLVSAAAAATGVFGEPVEVPVISPIARSLDIVPAPVTRCRLPASRRVPAARRAWPRRANASTR